MSEMNMNNTICALSSQDINFDIKSNKLGYVKNCGR